MSQELFTIGHSRHAFPYFLSLLKRHKISAICDVRSTPYSRMYPHFSREALRRELKLQNIDYVFLGEELGGRSSDVSCYDADGRVRYDRISDTDAFRRGLSRVKEGMKRYRIALMCTEKDPLTCHRTILICRHLCSEKDLSVLHILEDGQTESHEESESRLLRLARMEQANLFESFQDRLEEAYDYQGKRIAYRMRSPKGTSEGHEEPEGES